MKRFFLLALFASPTLAFPSEPTPSERAQVALALARSQVAALAPAAPAAPAEYGSACINTERLHQAESPAVIKSRSYKQGHALAVASNQPLVVFVNLPAFTVPDCVVCSADTFPGVNAPGVVVGMPDGKGCLDQAASFYGPTTLERIQGTILWWKMQPIAVPPMQGPGGDRGFFSTPRFSVRGGRGGC